MGRSWRLNSPPNRPIVTIRGPCCLASPMTCGRQGFWATPSLFHTSRRTVFCPGGTFDSSPAISLLGTEVEEKRLVPAGTTEDLPRNCVVNRPYGTPDRDRATIRPSNELLGYYQAPLRGKVPAIWAQPRGQRLAPAKPPPLGRHCLDLGTIPELVIKTVIFQFQSVWRPFRSWSSKRRFSNFTSPDNLSFVGWQ